MRNWIKLLSVFVSVTLVCSDLLAFAPASALAPATGRATTISDTRWTGLTLPASVGIIDDAFRPQGSDRRYPQVVLFQDAHANPSGQFNLAKSLEIILRTTGAREVLVEGGWGDVSLTSLKKGVATDKARSVAASFVRKGRMHGEEYLNLTSDIDFRIFGAEQEELYFQSLDAYANAVAERNKGQRYIDRIRRGIEPYRKQIFKEELRTLLDLRDLYRNHQVELTHYLERLLDSAKKQNVDLSSYPTVGQLRRLMARERAVDFAAASKQEAAAVRMLPAEDQADLKQITDKSGVHPARDAIAARALLLEEKLGPAAAQYPALKKYFAYLHASNRFKALSVLREIESLERAVIDRLIESPLEQELFNSLEASDLLVKLLNLQISPEGIAALRAIDASAGSDALTGFVNSRIFERGAGYDGVVELKEDLDRARAAAEAFYAFCARRDEVMLEALEPQLREGKTALLVTGGFHTRALTEQLKLRGISYASVMPQLIEETDHARYEASLLATTRPISGGARLATARSSRLETATSESIARTKRELSTALDAARLADVVLHLGVTVAAEPDLSGSQLGVNNARVVEGARLAKNKFVVRALRRIQARVTDWQNGLSILYPDLTSPANLEQAGIAAIQLDSNARELLANGSITDPKVMAALREWQLIASEISLEQPGSMHPGVFNTDAAKDAGFVTLLAPRADGRKVLLILGPADVQDAEAQQRRVAVEDYLQIKVVIQSSEGFTLGYGGINTFMKWVSTMLSEFFGVVVVSWGKDDATISEELTLAGVLGKFRKPGSPVSPSDRHKTNLRVWEARKGKVPGYGTHHEATELSTAMVDHVKANHSEAAIWFFNAWYNGRAVEKVRDLFSRSGMAIVSMFHSVQVNKPWKAGAFSNASGSPLIGMWGQNRAVWMESSYAKADGIIAIAKANEGEITRAYGIGKTGRQVQMSHFDYLLQNYPEPLSKELSPDQMSQAIAERRSSLLQNLENNGYIQIRMLKSGEQSIYLTNKFMAKIRKFEKWHDRLMAAAFKEGLLDENGYVTSEGAAVSLSIPNSSQIEVFIQKYDEEPPAGKNMPRLNMDESLDPLDLPILLLTSIPRATGIQKRTRLIHHGIPMDKPAKRLSREQTFGAIKDYLSAPDVKAVNIVRVDKPEPALIEAGFEMSEETDAEGKLWFVYDKSRHQNERLAAARDYKDDTVMLSYVGRIAGQKGFIQMMEAMKELRAQGRKVVLVVIAAGADSEEMRLMAARELPRDPDIVWINRFLDRPEHKANIVGESTVAEVPSTDEPFGYVLPEAMVSREELPDSNPDSRMNGGTPVAAFKHAGGPDDIIQSDADGRPINGILAEHKNGRDYAEAIIKILDLPEADYRRLRFTTNQNVRKRFNLRTSAAVKTANFFLDLMYPSQIQVMHERIEELSGDQEFFSDGGDGPVDQRSSQRTIRIYSQEFLDYFGPTARTLRFFLYSNPDIYGQYPDIFEQGGTPGIIIKTKAHKARDIDTLLTISPRLGARLADQWNRNALFASWVGSTHPSFGGAEDVQAIYAFGRGDVIQVARSRGTLTVVPVGASEPGILGNRTWFPQGKITVVGDYRSGRLVPVEAIAQLITSNPSDPADAFQNAALQRLYAQGVTYPKNIGWSDSMVSAVTHWWGKKTVWLRDSNYRAMTRDRGRSLRAMRKLMKVVTADGKKLPMDFAIPGWDSVFDYKNMVGSTDASTGGQIDGVESLLIQLDIFLRDAAVLLAQNPHARVFLPKAENLFAGAAEAGLILRRVQQEQIANMLNRWEYERGAGKSLFHEGRLGTQGSPSSEDSFSVWLGTMMEADRLVVVMANAADLDEAASGAKSNAGFIRIRPTRSAQTINWLGVYAVAHQALDLVMRKELAGPGQVRAVTLAEAFYHFEGIGNGDAPGIKRSMRVVYGEAIKDVDDLLRRMQGQTPYDDNQRPVIYNLSVRLFEAIRSMLITSRMA